jgi:beta-lactamase regulating signal transducer with metallopeptidase domain
MNAIPELDAWLRMTTEPVAQAIGWALLQFVWQGALIGAITAATLAALRRSNADVRYVVSTIALCLMLTVAVVTAVQGISAARTPVIGGATRSAQLPHAVVSVRGTAAGSVPALPAVTADDSSTSGSTVPRVWNFRRFAPWILAAWTFGVLLLTLRLATGWLWVRHLRAHVIPARASLAEVGARLARRLRVSRTVRLLESSIVEVPTVVGWLKPVILIPTSALAGLTPLQLEAILAHELAHIRRHDYLVNLIQTLVETLLFYHPAVWWVSKQIRIERENCCDDLAVSLCGDPVLYAQALADLEHLRGAGSNLVLAASGGSLVHRVRRLLGAPTHAGRAPSWLAGAVSVVVIIAMAGIVAAAVGRESATRSPRSAERAGSARAAGYPRSADEVKDSVKHGMKESTQLLREGLYQLRAGAYQIREGLYQIRMAAHWQFRQLPPPPPVPPVRSVPPEAPEPPALPDLADLVESAEPPEPPLAPEPPEPPQATETSELPVPPEAPVPPVAPEPPAASFAAMFGSVGQVQESHSSRGHSSGNFVWSRNGEKLEANYRGEVEFTDDDQDVKSLTPGGWLRIKDRGNTVEFRSDASGNIERRFWSGSREQPFEPEGRKWLQQVLPRFIRQTGIGARARVQRIYRTKGAPGVLAEVSLIEGSWAKRIYLSELLKTPGLDPRSVEQAFAQAGREIDSDFELASLLITADGLLTSDATRKAYLDAARTIDSDFEMRRVFSSALKRGPLTPSILAGVLETSTAIDSDFELASLLVDVAKLQPMDESVRAPFFKALDTVGSDFERRRVLTVVMKRTDVSPEATAAALTSATSIRSDFENASVLLEVVTSRSVEGPLRQPFFDALASIQSPFERGRVLQAVVKRTDASDQTILEVIKATQQMSASFESAQVLLAVSAGKPLTREARDAYVDAAEKLGDFDQGRVLTALVKNERRQ